jgi:hypothetical protein
MSWLTDSYEAYERYERRGPLDAKHAADKYAASDKYAADKYAEEKLYEEQYAEKFGPKYEEKFAPKYEDKVSLREAMPPPERDSLLTSSQQTPRHALLLPADSPPAVRPARSACLDLACPHPPLQRHPHPPARLLLATPAVSAIPTYSDPNNKPQYYEAIDKHGEEKIAYEHKEVYSPYGDEYKESYYGYGGPSKVSRPGSVHRVWREAGTAGLVAAS